MTNTAHAIGATDTPLLEETIGSAFDRTVAAYPGREALVVPFQGVRLTYRQLGERVDRLARGLIAMELLKGDRLGMWSPNNAEWVYIQFAAAKAGVVLVNINPAYQTEELHYALAQSGCRALVSATGFRSSDYVGMIAEVRGSLPDIEHVVFLDTPSWDAMLVAGDSIGPQHLAVRSASLTNRDPINIQYTSGTTGFPKGATLSHHNILNNGFFVGIGCRYTEEDRICIPVPLYHCFGMVMGNLGAITHGACMVYPEAAFDPGATLRAVADERCTSLYGVPTMFIAQLGHPDFDSTSFDSLRTGLMAGSPCPVEVMKQVTSRMHMPEVGIAYGMTETSPVSTQTATDDTLDRRTGTVGSVHPHVEVKIVDPDTGRVVPRGATGEFCTRGYSVMLGYWMEPGKTADAIDQAGWMHTGDLATMDDDGYVNIVGRIKDMIIRGGENVYPREVEEFLYSHPDIADVQVIGVPDAKYGEEIMAWVTLREGAGPISAEDLRAYCQGNIAHYKIPRHVKITDSFPMTVTGKVRKIEMREISIGELGLEAAAAVKNA